MRVDNTKPFKLNHDKITSGWEQWKKDNPHVDLTFDGDLADWAEDRNNCKCEECESKRGKFMTYSASDYSVFENIGISAQSFNGTQHINVKFKKLHDECILPSYAKDGDAGLDCFAVSDAEITDTYIGYKLGFAVEIPKGYVGLLYPRSSVSKKDLLLANSVGIIDSGFRSEVEARFKPAYILDEIGGSTYIGARNNRKYKKGEAICQLIIMPYPQINPVWADKLSETERGNGGFGSSGR